MTVAKLYDLARMTTSTTGTTSPMTLVAAVSGFSTFANAGVANGDVVFYAINDGANSEAGTGVYSSTGPTLTRSVVRSTNANALISLSGSAQVFISPLAEGLTDAGNIATGTFGVPVKLMVGTTALAPLQFQAGTNLTAALAGVLEYDGSVFYGSFAANSRGVIDVEQYVQLSAAYTLTSQTAVQKLFNATTNGALTLPVGIYDFECMFSLSSMSATSGSFGFAFGGTATITQAWWATANKPTALATPAAAQDSFNVAANTALATASTGTVGYAHIRGTIRVTVAGTIIPQVSLGVAAAAIVGANSLFRINPVGPSGATNVGNWS